MSPPTSPATAAPRSPGRGWPQAVGAVLAGLLAMAVVAGLGLWAAGATDLPDNAFPRVVTATMVASVGGVVNGSGEAGGLVDTEASLTVIPLSVTLTGALVIGWGFLRPLRHRTRAEPGVAAVWAARLGALWLIALIGLSLAARQTFDVPLEEAGPADLADFFGIEPTVGFAADVPLSVLFGLLWLAGVLVLALLVSRRAPLPASLARLETTVRPVAYAMVALLLACVAIGVVIGLVVAGTRGHPTRTLAVLLLGLPNVVWPALTIGMGAAWDGHVDGPFALPLPHILDEALRGPGTSTLDLGTLAQQDGRAWWLLVVTAVLLPAAGAVTAARTPGRPSAWRNAVRMAVALFLTVLMICLMGRISADYGLSVWGIGDLEGALSGDVFLSPRVWRALGLAVAWGLVAGFVGALLVRARPRRSRDGIAEGRPD
ncbi:streptophobe family protein [Streptomyces sp. WMMC905]|uniref:streptophobe family protein n=1 Tax=Streptomyces sp. WMMC905 TaxID=3404123 RepID=UPI003B932C36